ncbi:transposase [Pontibacter sp. CAU 1760]
MERKRLPKEQIAAILKELEGGKSVAEISREHGVSQSAVYSWQRQGTANSLMHREGVHELKREILKLKAKNAQLAQELELAKEIIAKKP